MIQSQLFQPFAYSADELSKQCLSTKQIKGSVFGLGYCHGAMRSGKYGIPKIKAYRDEIPSNFITYSESTSVKDYSCGLASFDDDIILERVWNNFDKYIPIFSKFICVGEPDFSLKIEYPLAVQIANVYRNHALGFKMQDSDIHVLPAPSWSTPVSYEFCFDGYEKGGAVLISTIGTLSDERSSMYFRLGFEEMLKRLSPDAVVLYGDVNESLMNWLPKQLHVSHVEHNRFLRARNHGIERRI